MIWRSSDRVPLGVLHGRNMAVTTMGLISQRPPMPERAPSVAESDPSAPSLYASSCVEYPSRSNVDHDNEHLFHISCTVV